MSTLKLLDWLLNKFLCELPANSKVLISNDNHFLLILAAVIDLINNQHNKNKIKKHEIIKHLQQINFEFKDIKTLQNTIDAITEHAQHITICKYIKKYYQFVSTILSHLQSLAIKIDKPLIIGFIISNKINETTFSNKNKNDFINGLIQNCNINKLYATQLYKKIKKTQTSKFILETNGQNQNVYSFGVQFWYSKWRNIFGNNTQYINIETHFDNFKDEMTDPNGKIFLSIDRWNIERQKAINNRNKEECKQYCVTTRSAIAFKIPSNTLISVQHLIALQIYCNHRRAQRCLSATYRIEQIGDNNDDIIEYEHKYYANWGRLLYESVNVFGNRQWDNKYFYHGINNEMLFTKTIFIYIYSPLSTTSNKNIAINKFSGENGMVIKLDGSMNNCFDCNFITDYPDEKEFLFIGSINNL
eukprot:29971_1